MQFALLEHSTSGGIHWDLLLEFATDADLAAWRLECDPTVTHEPVRAIRIADHRRVYLNYEGELSGGRGHVRRLDRGVCETRAFDHATMRLTMEGQRLRGEFILRREGGGAERFIRVEPPQMTLHE